VDVQFKILGPIEIELEGRTARVPRGRALSLLALLLVRHGDAVHLDRVVDELWDGAGPQHARNAVHVVASRLRAVLGDDLVVSEGGGYRLALPPGALDADRFEERLRLGREELVQGEPWEAAGTLRHALELWRGPALADVADERFARPEIARLGDLRLGCLSARIEADLACGRHAEVVGELDALVREHPLREGLRAQLMLALYRTGRQADALAAYRDARDALVEGLGIEPSPALRALESAILRHEVPEPAPPRERAPVATDARRWVTCVFAQLTGAEEPAGADPEALRAVVSRFHDAALAVCEGHEGSVVERRSDAVLAVLGIPVAHEDDAQRALRAAVELGTRVEQLPFGRRARTGVCTGEVVAASGPADAGPVIGEPVAVAERLARSGAGGEIRLSASTWQVVRHAAHASALADGGFLLESVDPDAPAIGRRLDQPLIGREREVGVLRATFARVMAERSPELLTIIGEPGIGKSRLVAELSAIAGEHGTVLTGRCPAYGEGITLWPLREAVLQVKRDHSADELAVALGIPAVAVRRVAAAVGIEDGEPGEDTDWAFLQLVGALARVEPLVIVVDDAHWAEPALLELLLDLVARLPDAPLLVVWVARPDLLERGGGRVDRGSALTLRPLSPTASESLLAAIAGGRLSDEEKRQITQAADGNPLFLEQLVAYVGEQGAAGALPPALQALLAARLDRLDAAERSALALGAIAGDRFDASSVHALAVGVARADVERACERLVARDLLVRDEPGAERLWLRFRHTLIRDVAYASLAKTARARLHERHAAWLEALGSDVAEADAHIGFHLESACRFAREVGGVAPPALAARAGARLAAAAAAAHGRGDLSGEVGFLDRAVALLGDDTPEGAELLPGLVSALFESGSSDRAEALADRAVSVSASLGLTRVHARARIEREHIRLSCHPETFRPERSIGVVAEAADTLRALGDELGLARAAYLKSDLSWLIGDPVSSYASAEEMLLLARRAGSDFDAATALVFLAWCLVEGPWPALEAIARCDSLAQQAAAEGERAGELSLLGCRAVLMAMTGRYDEARGDMARARAGFTELRVDLMAAYLALLVALAESLVGDPVAAERAVRDAEAMVSGPGDRWYQSMINVDFAHAIIAQGRDADAIAAVRRIDLVPAPCDLQWMVKRLTGRARIAARAGDHDRAVAEARAAVAAARPCGLILLKADAERTLGEVLRGAGQIDEAKTVLGRALALDEAKHNLVAAAATRRLLASLGA
jgi:DNA-binding SARP family transcriptional activator